MELLDRGPVLAALDEELAVVLRGSGRVVLLVGEAGIGKTSVVNAFRSTQQNQVRFVVGQCDPLSVPRTLGPILDIAEQLKLTLPAMAPIGPERPEGVGAHASTFLSGMQAAPTVAVIEDAHWADGATLDFLVFAWRRLAMSPTLWIVTFRSDEVAPGHPLRLALGRTATARPRRVAVPPLSPDAVAALAAGSGIDPAELTRLTAGNPFYVTEVLAAGVERVPPSVLESVLARADLLSREGRDALAAAAVFPTGAWYDDLARLVGRTDGIDACLDGGILELTERRLRFHHELARRAVWDALPLQHRKELHATALDVLEIARAHDPRAAVTADLAELSFHAIQAGLPGAITRYSLLAGDRALAADSNRAAVQHYRDALSRGSPLASRQRAETLEKLARSLAAVGAEADAAHAYKQASDLWAELDAVAEQGLAGVQMAIHRWGAGDGDEARASIQGTVRLLKSVGGGPLAAAYAEQAMLCMLARDLPGALDAGQRAVQLAVPGGRGDQTLSRAYNAIGTALWVARPQEAETTLLKSLSYAHATDQPRLVASAMVNLGSGAGEVREYEVAEVWLDEAMKWCERRDLDSSGDYARAWKARVALERGRWTESAGLAHQVLAVTVVPNARLVALTVLGLVRARRGDSGTDTLSEAWEMAVSTGDLQRLWPVAAARAEASWWSTGRVTNLADIEQTLAMAVRLEHPWAVGELAWWLQRGSGHAVNADGAAAGFHASLAEDFTDAASIWFAVGCPFEAALAQLDSGLEHHVRQSLNGFEALGAVPAARAARRRLRTLGARHIPRGPRPETTSHPAGLTPREVDVLESLTRGSSNALIAAELVISHRTVDRHVSNLLRKLGVTTREEAAAVARTWDGAPKMGGR